MDPDASARKGETVYPFPTLNHDQLLTLASKTRAAAQDHDPDRLETDALRLFQSLVDHVLAERPVLLHTPPAEARLLERGQQRVVNLLVELAATAAERPDECRCDHVAEELVAELALQADDERHALVTGGISW
jgi:hypothetical protein